MALLFLALVAATVLLTAAVPRGLALAPCNVSGYWTYTPEPTSSYHWEETAVGDIGCFLGQDSWRGGVGHVEGNNVRACVHVVVAQGAAMHMLQLLAGED